LSLISSTGCLRLPQMSLPVHIVASDQTDRCSRLFNDWRIFSARPHAFSIGGWILRKAITDGPHRNCSLPVLTAHDKWRDLNSADCCKKVTALDTNGCGTVANA
jgi:hypothetical protein